MTEDQYDAKVRELIQRNTRDTLICNKTFFLQELTEALRELGQERDKWKNKAIETLCDLDKNLTKIQAMENVGVKLLAERDSLKSALDLSTQMIEERDMQIDSLKQKIEIASIALKAINNGGPRKNVFDALTIIAREALAEIEGK